MIKGQIKDEMLGSSSTKKIEVFVQGSEKQQNEAIFSNNCTVGNSVLPIRYIFNSLYF